MTFQIGDFDPNVIRASDIQKEFSAIIVRVAGVAPTPNVNGKGVEFEKMNPPASDEDAAPPEEGEAPPEDEAAVAQASPPTGKVSEQSGNEIFIKYEIPSTAEDGNYIVRIVVANGVFIEGLETIKLKGQTKNKRKRKDDCD